MKVAIRSISVVLVLFLVSASAQAGLLRSSAPGDTVTYKDIYESISGSGTYGTPGVIGDSLDFNPLGLGVLANDSTGGSDFNDAQLQFGVEAHNGHYIEKLQFSEAGDYFLSGLGNHAGVTATFFVDIYEVDGNTPVNISESFIFEFGDFTRPEDPLVGLWSGDVDLDINQILLDNGVPFAQGATRVSVNLDNLMYADSAAGTYSSLKKKDADGFTVTAVVPEPSSVVLLVGASSLIVFARSRFLT